MTKFEVGKKYKDKFGSIAECVHVSEAPNTIYVSMVFRDGSADTGTDRFWSDFKEYLPPVEHVRYVHFYRSNESYHVFSSTTEKKKPVYITNCTHLETIKVVCVENLDETA